MLGSQKKIDFNLVDFKFDDNRFFKIQRLHPFDPNNNDVRVYVKRKVAKTTM